MRKTDRAVTHLHALQREIETFSDAKTEAFRPIPEVDVESSRYLVRVKIERPLPDWWGLILGDFVQNLRAALDQLVCQLIYSKGEEPTNRHAFPIFDEPPTSKTRRKWNQMIEGLSPEAVDFIEGTQPYNGPDGPRAHLLHALRELSNEDKHRLLLPAVAAIREPEGALSIDVTHSRDVGPLKGGRLYAGRALEDGDIVLEAPVEITGPNPHVETNETLELEIGLGRDPIVPANALLRMLQTVRLTVHLAARRLFGYSDTVVEAELREAERRGWVSRT